MADTRYEDGPAAAAGQRQAAKAAREKIKELAPLAGIQGSDEEMKGTSQKESPDDIPSDPADARDDEELDKQADEGMALTACMHATCPPRFCFLVQGYL